ncbi:hypothetical protein BGZ95_011036 [Linnemannia exigua]|uniref:IPT/TIG domain-containing protein n=1 Tax=Linnemannia exigua TaxID=604196 RepID=A0AAD4DC85_9FUNG|nr:hypothetical protein BGZ95_011036 [Linnemannia exigua]
MSHSTSHSATASLEALTNNSYHDDSSSRLYSHHDPSVTSSSSPTPPTPVPVPRTQNPQGSESGTVQQPMVGAAANMQEPLSDAWAEHGHFPLALNSVSRRTVPVRGGSTILLTGDNFRAGVQVVIACVSLGENSTKIEYKIVTPRVLKSTEMEFVVPNLLDWWASSSTTTTTTIAPKTLQLSVTLACAGGVKDTSDDPIITFDMVAIEDSETELLHTIIGLHRQLIYASLTAEPGTETERNTRQKTLALLNLDQPPTVTRSEHLALGVIYMLCDGRDLISDDGMDIVRCVTRDGHDMLHLAVVLGLKTLVRELARHLLGTFQSCAITSDNEVFTRDSNDLTALDFAKLLSHADIEEVLTATLQAAQDHKRTILGRTARPLPSVPLPQPSSATQPPTPPKPSRSSTLNGSPVLSNSASSAITSGSVDRPLPPTPLTSPYKPSPPETRGNHSYFPSMAGIDATLMSQSPPLTETTTAPTAATTAEHHPPQRVNTAQAIIGEGDNHTAQCHGGIIVTKAEHDPIIYPGHSEPHVVTHQFPAYQPQHHQHQHNQHQHTQWQQHQHQQPMPQPHYYPPHHQPNQQQQQHEQPILTVVQHAPTLPNMPHLQAHGHHLNTVRPELPTPPRANSVPIPRPINPHLSNPHPSPIIENPLLPILATSPAGTYRPLPTASFKAPSSLPPPKHKVTRVNRPKTFVVSTSASETTPTTMPVPEPAPALQHRPMVIPPLLPDPTPHLHPLPQPHPHPHPHQYPVGNGGHYQHHVMPLPTPVPVPMAHQGNHMAHRQESWHDDQIKVAITQQSSHMPPRQNAYGPPRNDDLVKVPIA